MITLPLYRERQEWAVFGVEALKPQPSCDDCARSAACLNPCQPRRVSEGSRRVLCVLGAPTSDEDRSGIAGSARSYAALSQTLQFHEDAQVTWAYGVRCYANSVPRVAEVRACRSYLRHVIEDVQPEIILAFGSQAYMSVTGHKPGRVGCYDWCNGICIVSMADPLKIRGNAAKRKQLTTAVSQALTNELPPERPDDGQVVVVETVEDAREAVAALRDAPFAAYDVETYGRRFYDDDYRLLSLAATPASGDVNVAYVWEGGNITKGSPVVAPLVEWLGDSTAQKVGQNVKFDNGAVREALGVRVLGVYGDTRLWSKLLDHGSQAGLAAQAGLVGMGGHKDEAEGILKPEVLSLRKAGGREALNPRAYAYAALPYDILVRYNALDAIVTARLALCWMAMFEDAPELWSVWQNQVRPASDAITEVERWGVPLDREAIEALGSYIEMRQVDLHAAFEGYGVNPNSTAELSKFLFEDLGLRVRKRTAKGKPSVDRETLKSLEGKHAIVSQTLELRQLSKIKSTYVDGLLGSISSDGRVHPDLLLDGAASGRLSCREPNLQNIPRADTDLGHAVRAAFRAGPGMTFLQADYSQLELRVAAMLSGDPEMLAIFNSGVDYHMRTAQLVSQQAWGIPAEQVTKKHRTAAKAFNFGLLYGMSDAGIAHSVGCTVREAEKLRASILGKFKVLAKWIRGQQQQAKKTGYARTYWQGKPARRRPLPNLWSSDPREKASAERATWNSPIQGTASDLCLASLVAVTDWVIADAVPAKVVITVHDSIVLEVEDSALEEAAWHLRDIMASWTDEVPLVVDLEVGKDWASMKDYDGVV